MKRGSPAPSRIVVNTHHLLYGEHLEDIGRSNIVVEGGVISGIERGFSSDAEYTVDVVMPLPVNSHVHLSDARIPERCIGLSLSGYVGRKGLKHPYIRLVKEPLIPGEIMEDLVMYAAIGDYQEIWTHCSRYKNMLDDWGIKYVGLSRPENWDNASSRELEEIAGVCGGIGISNPSVIPPHQLPVLVDLSRRYIVSAHISESRWMEETGGLHYLLSAGIRLRHVVHGVFLERWELRLLAENNIVLVVNPRSNIWFASRIADIEYLIENGGRYAIGSDNTGCFHPNILSDAELLYTLKPELDPKSIVEALTINGYLALGLKPLTILEGEPAYFLGLNIGLSSRRTPNIYSSIVKRGLYSGFIIVFKGVHHYIIDKRMYRRR